MNASVVLSALAASVLVAAPPEAQTCAAPTSAPLVPDLTPVWGGEFRAVVAWDVRGARHVLFGEDGGRIRLSTDDGASWSYSAVPADYRGAVLDIFMQDDLKGFACGRNGRVLRTTDGGVSWSYFGNPVFDPCAERATLWSVRPVTDTVVLVAGLWTLRVTVDAGATWDTLNLFTQNTGTALVGPLDESAFHFYRLAVLGSLGNTVANVAAEWEISATDRRGVVLYTDVTDPLANSGRNWWITLDDTSVAPKPNPPNQGAVMTEPWDIAYERGGTGTPSTAVGYVVGGPGGNSASRWWKTTNGGASWSIDGDTSVTMYGVAVEPGDTVMIVGYSGQYETRTAGGAWSGVNILPSGLNQPPGGTQFRGAILAVDSYDGDFHIGGSFGVQRKTPDLGATWLTQSPYDDLDEKEWRVKDVHFQPERPNLGTMVGQSERILFTSDYGCSWDVRNSGTGDGLLAIDFRTFRNGATCGAKGGFHYTLDGYNWNPSDLSAVTNSVALHLTDVDLVGADEGFAVGYRGNANPAVLVTADKGATWTEVNAPVIAGGVRLQSVAAANANELLVVGYTRVGGQETTARAWSGVLSSGTVAWTEHSPPHPTGFAEHGRKLLGVALAGTTLANATGYAVGNNGMVLEWNGSTFVDVPAVYDIDGSGMVLSRLVDIDLQSLDFSPSGNVVLIGAQYDADLDDADDKGWLLRLDAGGWELVNSRTSKDVFGVTLTSDTEGFLLGRAENLGAEHQDDCMEFMKVQGSFIDKDPVSSSFDNGNLADSVLLRYDAQ